MWKALAIKELRESAAILAAAALAMLWVLGSMMGWQFTPYALVEDVVYDIPFQGTSFHGALLLVGGTLAIALGLKQSAWENNGNQFYFLLHRPVTRRYVFTVKILMGVGCLLLLTVSPLLIYADWAATPGNHATPFYWDMTFETWRICWALPTVYLGAVLAGLRPARWFGSRLLPLIGVSVYAATAILVWNEVSATLGIACLLALDLLLWKLILETAEQRDY